MRPVEIVQGEGPIIFGQPHGGLHVPEEVFARLNEKGRALTDTDWRIAELYNGLLPGATIVRATFHRYVIDANRDPSGASLYPGQATTGLVPLETFDGEPIWIDPPAEEEIARGRLPFHLAYHAALEAEIARVKAVHGVAVLYDCHSIRSVIPRLFAGDLPVFNVGTNDGSTCAREIERAVADIVAASGLPYIVNGRFKGGWTTRRYGRPETGVHAIQMEIAQRAYLKEEAAPWEIDPGKAEKLRRRLRDVILAVEGMAYALADA